MSVRNYLLDVYVFLSTPTCNPMTSPYCHDQWHLIRAVPSQLLAPPNLLDHGILDLEGAESPPSPTPPTTNGVVRRPRPREQRAWPKLMLDQFSIVTAHLKKNLLKPLPRTLVSTGKGWIWALGFLESSPGSSNVKLGLRTREAGSENVFLASLLP